MPLSHAGLPIGTSIYSILRDRLNPGIKFWLFALMGTFLSCWFFFMNVERILFDDLLLLLAVLSASFGYVEGGRSSRLYGGARTMSFNCSPDPIIITSGYKHSIALILHTLDKKSFSTLGQTSPKALQLLPKVPPKFHQSSTKVPPIQKKPLCEIRLLEV